MSVPADRLTRSPLRQGGPWMTPTGHRPPSDVRPRAARFGLGRAATAAPAVLGSLLLVTLVSAALGRWVALLLPLGWAAGTAVLMTRVGERMTLRAACGFHRPGPAQAASLQPAWLTALRVTGTAARDFELYVQTDWAPNACAAGGRSVAVTSRGVEDHATGRLPEGQLVAVLVHELGHHATGATRTMLLMAWLTAPWRVARSLLTEVASCLAGRRSRRGPLLAVVVGLAVAVMRALSQGQWMAGGVLGFVGVAAVLCPSPTPRSAGGPSSAPTPSPPITAWPCRWPPPCASSTAAATPAAVGRGGC